MRRTFTARVINFVSLGTLGSASQKSNKCTRETIQSNPFLSSLHQSSTTVEKQHRQKHRKRREQEQKTAEILHKNAYSHATFSPHHQKQLHHVAAAAQFKSCLWIAERDLAKFEPPLVVAAKEVGKAVGLLRALGKGQKKNTENEEVIFFYNSQQVTRPEVVELHVPPHEGFTQMMAVDQKMFSDEDIQCRLKKVAAEKGQTSSVWVTSKQLAVFQKKGVTVKPDVEGVRLQGNGTDGAIWYNAEDTTNPAAVEDFHGTKSAHRSALTGREFCSVDQRRLSHAARNMNFRSTQWFERKTLDNYSHRLRKGSFGIKLWRLDGTYATVFNADQCVEPKISMAPCKDWEVLDADLFDDHPHYDVTTACVFPMHFQGSLKSVAKREGFLSVLWISPRHMMEMSLELKPQEGCYTPRSTPFYNIDQLLHTTDQVKCMALAIRNVSTGHAFDRETARELAQAMRALRVSSPLWLSVEQLSMLRPLIGVRRDAQAVRVETREGASSLFLNVEQTLDSRRLCQEYYEKSKRAQRAEAQRMDATPLYEVVESRGFLSPFWLTVDQLRGLTPPVEVRPEEMKNGTEFNGTLMYNAEQTTDPEAIERHFCGAEGSETEGGGRDDSDKSDGEGPKQGAEGKVPLLS